MKAKFNAREKQVKNFSECKALVTGAGSGIGRATAMELAAQGARVIVTDIDLEAARRTAEQARSEGGVAEAHRLDVSDAGNIQTLADELETSGDTPQVLVNNAGIAVGGYFLDTSAESWQRVVDINLMGVVQCCKAFLPHMVASGREGQVVNIASILGQLALPGVSAYCMTKFGVVGFSESLRAELAEYRIGVSTICPGMIRTNIVSSGQLESSEDDLAERRRSIETLFEKRNYPPERVARAIIKAIRKNRAVVPVAPEAWVSYYLKRWTPWLVASVARRVRP